MFPSMPSFEKATSNTQASNFRKILCLESPKLQKLILLFKPKQVLMEVNASVLSYAFYALGHPGFILII